MLVRVVSRFLPENEKLEPRTHTKQHEIKKSQTNHYRKFASDSSMEGSESNCRATRLFTLKHGFAFLEKCGNAFALVFGREADRKKIDLAAKPFVEVRA